MDKDIETINRHIVDLEAQLKRLQELKKDVLESKTFSIEYRIAKLLHQKFCMVNHEDMCGWFYEENMPNTWNQPTHKRWLGKAKWFLNKLPGIDRELVFRVIVNLPI